MGPVTVEEYESRAERYDEQLKENVGIDPATVDIGMMHKIYTKDATVIDV